MLIVAPQHLSPSPLGCTVVEPASTSSTSLLRSLVAHVRLLAEEGDLPLFVWTLGLPKEALCRMLEEFHLPSSALSTMTSAGFARIECLVPKVYHDLRLMLFQNRTRLVDAILADYLSRALAGACFGNRQLWEDLGLANDEELTSFIATFFVPLQLRHKRCHHWKRQFFRDLYTPSEAGFSVPDLLLKCVLTHQ